MRVKSLTTLEDRDGQTDGLCGASSVMKRGTSHTAVLPKLCYSACCGNGHKSKPDGRPGGKCWNSLRPMTALAPLRCI